MYVLVNINKYIIKSINILHTYFCVCIRMFSEECDAFEFDDRLNRPNKLT